MRLARAVQNDRPCLVPQHVKRDPNWTDLTTHRFALALIWVSFSLVSFHVLSNLWKWGRASLELVSLYTRATTQQANVGNDWPKGLALGACDYTLAFNMWRLQTASLSVHASPHQRRVEIRHPSQSDPSSPRV